MTLEGWCPSDDCDLVWTDHEPGDTLRCPYCEERVTLEMPPEDER